MSQGRRQRRFPIGDYDDAKFGTQGWICMEYVCIYTGMHAATLPLASEQIRKAYDLQDKQADKHAICMSMLIRIIILQFVWAQADLATKIVRFLTFN